MKVSGSRNVKVIREMLRKEMKWREKSKRSEATLTVRMKHEDEKWDERRLKLEPKRRQSQDNDTDNKKRDYENERSSMHDDSCSGINHAHAHMFSKCFKSLHRFHRSIMSFCTSFMCGLSIELLWAPPGIAPLPPTGGRTRWLVPILIVPEWHWLELSFTRFLV